VAKAFHQAPDDVKDLTVNELAERFVGRFKDKVADWDAFADARTEGFRRAQHRFIGSGASGKADPSAIPARAFTLSIMYVPPGQGNASHTHEIEEIFFVLQGHLRVFFEDEDGNRIDTVLGPWEVAACPPGIIHGYVNDSLEPVYFQVMLGRANPELMGYAEPEFLKQRDAHLRSPAPD
jgi:quercetin dioxygenase-like cupin family protein